MTNITALIRDWHTQEMQADYGLSGASMVTGCPLWSEGFTNDFLDYCLPSLIANSPHNCILVLFVDRATDIRLVESWPSDGGVPPLYLFRLPEPIMQALYAEPGHKYQLLAAVHNLLIHQAAKAGAGFHMLVADAIYSSSYFENLSRLAKTHAAIAHTGFAIVANTGLRVLDHFRRGDRLKISAQMLGQIGWEHLNPQWASWTMDGITDFAMMPNSHYIHWRGRNSVRIHCAHQSAAWISPERCKLATAGYGGTIDSELPRYMAGDFYSPTLEDEMTYVVIAGASEPTPRIPFEEFKAEFWRFIGDNRAFLPYFTNPCPVPVDEDENAPSDDELDARMDRLMAKLEEGRS